MFCWRLIKNNVMAATKLIKNRTTKTAPTEKGKLKISAKFTKGASEIFPTYLKNAIFSVNCNITFKAALFNIHIFLRHNKKLFEKYICTVCTYQVTKKTAINGSSSEWIEKNENW